MVRRTYSITGIASFMGLVLLAAIAFAQPAAPENEQHPAAQAPQTSSQPGGEQGMGIMGKKGMMGGMMGGRGMMGGQSMTGGQGMMGMPMMPCCPCAMMGMGMMSSGGQNLRSAAKMMEMHAEMMKANAAIMEKYVKELEAQK